MIRLVKFHILFLIITAISAYPQSIESITITGDKIFSVNDLIGWSGLKAGMNFRPGLIDSAKQNIAAAVSEFGYFYPSFHNDSTELRPDSTRIKIFLDFDEGEPSFIRNIIFENADSLDSVSVIKNFSFLQGEIFNTYSVEESITSSLTYYENSGNPFAKIQFVSFNLEYDSTENQNVCDLILKIIKGEQNYINRIEISGNTSTEDYVITRELRLNQGEVYSQKRVEELPKRLNRLRFFEPVSTPQYFLDKDNNGVLLINIKEKQTNNFDGIIGYIPGTKAGEKGYITGLVNVSLRNLFGTGRAAAVRWQQYDRFSQELELKYLEPWLFGFPFNVNGGLFQRKQDTTYVQRKLEGALEYLATEDISASVFIASESVIPTENETSVFSVYNSSAITTGVNLKIDTRDDPYSPTEGILFLNTYSFSQKKINGPEEYLATDLERNINIQRLFVDISLFYQFFSRQVAALGLHGREMRGPSFEESDLFRLGGTNSLRGYRENQFLGSRIFWSNLEYRLLLTQRTFAFVFFDTGYFLRKEESDRMIEKQEGFNIGYGLGLNIETGIGVLAVSFALAKGDSFSEGKIHFGIINEF
ncbi:MAG: BamA/TamA family outer membrane protein [Ignavibacteriales bacterium]|nr:MAG: BamA/TamA family outer membrane protein [Ignavibacteriales bacterium]